MIAVHSRSLLTLLRLPGLGGKKIAKLYQELGIVDIASLKEACLEQKVQQLPGFGKKTEEKVGWNSAVRRTNPGAN